MIFREPVVGLEHSPLAPEGFFLESLDFVIHLRALHHIAAADSVEIGGVGGEAAHIAFQGQAHAFGAHLSRVQGIGDALGGDGIEMDGGVAYGNPVFADSGDGLAAAGLGGVWCSNKNGITFGKTCLNWPLLDLCKPFWACSSKWTVDTWFPQADRILYITRFCMCERCW